MADAELKEKKFGYVVHPPYHPPCPPPPPPCPPGMSMTDWIAYINSYIDVRARQLYDKLKDLYTGGSISEDAIRDALNDHIFDKIRVRGGSSNDTVYVVDLDDEGCITSKPQNN
jgi:hypothetical protein